MNVRNKEFYNILDQGLASLGFSGDDSFEMYIQDMFAEKYNAEATFAQMGFPVNPDIPINPTYEQIEATIRPYTMATYVDIDSDGATKSTDGMALRMGGLPTFKHEVTLSRKTLREKMLLMDAIGKATPQILDTFMGLEFNGLDELLGGNYNTMKYQRNQIVSNEGKLVIDAHNNPLGIPMEIDFEVPSKNKKTEHWYSKSGPTVTQEANVGTKIDPIKTMRAVRYNAENVDYAPQGHWEVDKTTYEDLIALPYFRQMYVVATRPDISDPDKQAAFGNQVEDDVIKAYIERRIGARIVVVDSLAPVEKFNKESAKMEYANLKGFKEGVMVYVPDGDLGDVQFGRPIFMETPGSRAALYDGGRTLIRHIFNDENMIHTIKSEVTGLVVPNKVRWFYYLTVKK